MKTIDTSEKDGKITTNFKPINVEDVINKTYLDDKLSKIQCHTPLLQKDYNEIKIHNNKQSVEEVFIQRAGKQLYKYFIIRDFSLLFQMLIRF